MAAQSHRSSKRRKATFYGPCSECLATRPKIDFHEIEPNHMNEVTRILSALERGEPRAAEELLPLVYEELRRLAQWQMARERPGQTLQATALVHEAWLRLAGKDNLQDQAHWANRRHFFAAAAESMRRILIDIARRKQAARHGGAHLTEFQQAGKS